MFDLNKYWQFHTPLTYRIKRKGGLAIGYHDISLQFGWVLNYNGSLETEFDGSGIGNMAHLFGVDNKRRMLLCR